MAETQRLSLVTTAAATHAMIAFNTHHLFIMRTLFDKQLFFLLLAVRSVCTKQPDSTVVTTSHSEKVI